MSTSFLLIFLLSFFILEERSMRFFEYETSVMNFSWPCIFISLFTFFIFTLRELVVNFLVSSLILLISLFPEKDNRMRFFERWPSNVYLPTVSRENTTAWESWCRQSKVRITPVSNETLCWSWENCVSRGYVLPLFP